MRILAAHNYYLQSGGEDTEFQAETDLLRARGHEVIRYVEHNERIADANQLSIAAQTIWSWSSYRKIMKAVRDYHPAITHFHNTFPLISPSAYYACRDAGIPVIQTLHNPRLMCPSASLYRNGGLCTDCVGRLPWPGVLHACFHHSRPQTLVVAVMLVAHRWLKTWDEMVDRYLVPTEFYRDLLTKAGLPSKKLVVKPNFIPMDPRHGSAGSGGKYALFMGRLEPRKGVRTMLDAWRELKIPLKIRGDGDLEDESRRYIRDHGLLQVQLVPRVSKAELQKFIGGARFLIWPSEGYYEAFGLAAVECYAAGIPVLASRIGVMTEIVHDGQTGLLFNPGDSRDLTTKAQWLWDHPAECSRMGENAQREYEQKYTPERNYRMLMEIYTGAIASNRS